MSKKEVVAMKSKRLDGTYRGWLWMIGLCLMAFGSALWAVLGFASGEFLRTDLILAPALLLLGLAVLGVRLLAGRR